MRTWSLVAGFGGMLSLAAAAGGQEAAPQEILRVPRAVSPITVDGVLDEAAWESALRLTLPYEIYPGNNTPAPVRTECLLLYDDRNLYVGFRASDPRPGDIRVYLGDRDMLPTDEDQVTIVLDTFNDHRRGYAFAASPLGVQWDAIASEVGGTGLSFDSSWDAIWSSKGSIDGDGYVVEMAVPFTSLRFPRGGSDLVWGFHVMRFQPRSVIRQLSLRPIDRNNSCFLCQSIRLTGFSGLKTGTNLELDPTITARREDEREAFPVGPITNGPVSGEGGLTARWTMTPDLTLSAAFNPDFSQVEADIAQLKINTRFALYYPEKRPLFLEGADFFQTRLNTIYTRTVADPSWGTKLVGKVGRNALGVVVAEDNLTNLLFPANQGSQSASLDRSVTDAALRYRRDLGASSTIGLLYTGREGPGYSNQVAGVDGVIRLSEHDTINAQALASRTEYPASVAAQYDQPARPFRGAAVTLDYRHESEEWNWGVSGSDLGPHLRVDTGFIPRVDTRSIGASVERVVWGEPEGRLIRMSFGVTGSRTEDHDGLLTDGSEGLFFRWEGPLQSSLSAGVSRGKEFFKGVTYDQTREDASWSIAPWRRLSLSLSGDFGDEVDYDNSRPAKGARIVPALSLRLCRHLKADLDDTYETLNVEGGRLFRASLAQARLAWQFNVRAMARAILQYTDIRRRLSLYTDFCDPSDPTCAQPRALPPEVEKTLFTQLLFSYKVNPQTATYLGYSDDRLGEQGLPLRQSDRTVFFKIGYAWLP
ncbi:MAG: hypothetical protein AUH92_01985 [Acidobacteria bacterium 13_1_40CM_4_69_4]|nr:MAG: hypothetical protein AUH92_01985 [Acidobacteria bacterium 13_1_40CM_4_69_4]